jgi:hypothetical protein
VKKCKLRAKKFYNHGRRMKKLKLLLLVFALYFAETSCEQDYQEDPLPGINVIKLLLSSSVTA